MTEREWLTSTSPVALLHHLNADGYARKPLLYAIAVCEREPELLTDSLRAWVELAEEAINGEVTNADFDRDSRDADDEIGYLWEHGPTGTRAHYAAVLDVVCCTWPTESAELAPDNPIPPEELEPVRRACADLVRDIFGNPFRPVAFLPEWLTSTVVALAEQMYSSRDFSAMPILADALQDAGCENEEVLCHCREPKGHVRGCWVVDAVLGKE